MRNMNNLVCYPSFAATSNAMYQAHGGAYRENESNIHTEKCALSLRICRNNVKEPFDYIMLRECRYTLLCQYV